MQLFETIGEYLNRVSAYRNTIDFGDVLEICIIAVLVYYILAWMKTTRSWRLLKGVIVIGVFLVFAAIMEMTTITWIEKNVLGFAVTAFGGTILHFLYEWLDNAVWIAPFSGVNESTWEHMKLLYWPLFLFALVLLHTLGL